MGEGQGCKEGGGEGSTLWEGAHCPHQHSDVRANFSILWLHVLWNCQLPASISKIETMSQKLFKKKAQRYVAKAQIYCVGL